MSLAAARILHRREVGLSGSSGVTRETLTRAAVMTAGALAAWIPFVAFFAAKGALVVASEAVVLDALRDHSGVSVPLVPFGRIFESGASIGDRLEASLFYFPAAMALVRNAIMLWVHRDLFAFSAPGALALKVLGATVLWGSSLLLESCALKLFATEGLLHLGLRLTLLSAPAAVLLVYLLRRRGRPRQDSEPSA